MELGMDTAETVAAGRSVRHPSLNSMNKSTTVSKGGKLQRLRYLGLTHPPQLNLPVVCARDNEWHGGVEAGPVDPPVVAFKDVLDYAVGLAEQVSRVGVLHVVVEAARPRGNALLAKTCRGKRRLNFF